MTACAAANDGGLIRKAITTNGRIVLRTGDIAATICDLGWEVDLASGGVCVGVCFGGGKATLVFLLTVLTITPVGTRITFNSTTGFGSK